MKLEALNKKILKKKRWTTITSEDTQNFNLNFLQGNT